MKLFKKVLSLTAALSLLLATVPAYAFAATDAVDFEDGNFSAFTLQTKPDGSIDGDPALLSVTDFNGSKVLFIDSQEKGIPKIKIDLPALVGASNLDKVKTVSIDLVVTQPDAAAVPWQGGAIGANQGADGNTWYQGTEWTVQDDLKGTSDVTTITTTFGDGFGFVNDTPASYLFMNWGNSGSDMYVDNIKFLDADGNAVAVGASEVAATDAAATDDAAVPATGSTSLALFFLAGAAMMLVGAVVLKKRNSIEV